MSISRICKVSRTPVLLTCGALLLIKPVLSQTKPKKPKTFVWCTPAELNQQQQRSPICSEEIKRETVRSLDGETIGQMMWEDYRVIELYQQDYISIEQKKKLEADRI